MKMWYEKLENPVVKIGGIGSIKNYLKARVKAYNGYPIVHWIVRDNEIYIDILMEDNSEVWKKRVFFGYISDIAYNIQRGFYERTDK